MTPRPTGLVRRLAAMLYDLLLVIALLFLATVPYIAIRGGESVEPQTLSYQVGLFLVVFLFFVGYWSRRGRTLGMQSWGLQLQSPDGRIPSLGACTIRFFAAIVSWLPLGLGYLWQLWDRERLTWHDRISGTRVMHYPKPPKEKRKKASAGDAG